MRNSGFLGYGKVAVTEYMPNMWVKNHTFVTPSLLQTVSITLASFRYTAKRSNLVSHTWPRCLLNWAVDSKPPRCLQMISRKDSYVSLENVGLMWRRKNSTVSYCHHPIQYTIHHQTALDWYDNEHGPARLTIDGFSSALRYKATDSHQPTWLALYDLSTPEVTSSESYKALGANASQRELDIISRLQMLNRRVYKHFSTHEHLGARLPAKYLLVVSLEPSQEGEAEFNKWYEEEHMVLLSKVPGWLRGRRYKCLSQNERGGKADKSNAVPAISYLAIHDFDRNDFGELKEYKTAVSTSWRGRIMTEIVLRREIRHVFELYKDFSCSDHE